ncbi:MAG TPA: DUF6077 domain-containing protein [Pirellulales bacterium]|nr:DUF6077 domain-containing protein [Pirellulales bacterium]
MTPLLLIVPSLAAFVLPGFWWTSWLHRQEGLAWTIRLGLAFVWSFALFSLLSGPFLWWGGSFGTLLKTIYVVWPAYALLGWSLDRYRKGSQSPPPAQPNTAGKPLPSGEELSLGSSGRRWVFGLAAVYGLAASICLYLWAGREREVQAAILLFSPCLLALGGISALLLSRRLRALVAFDAEDKQPAPRLWTVVAVALIVGQAVASSLMFRPDWDDFFYLAAVRDYQETPALNARHPVSRDPAGLNLTHRVLCWELWGSVLCHLTGADPQTLLHSLLPGVLVLACYSGYLALFGEILPGRWVSLSLVGLSAYFLFGICGPFGGANHFLVRIWQGKSVLLHLALPFTATFVLRFSQRQTFASWASLAASVLAGLGFSTTAVFLDVALIGCLAIALLPAVPQGKAKFLFCAMASCAPMVFAAAALIVGLRGGEAIGHSGAPPTPLASIGRSCYVWFMNLAESNAGDGCADMLWLFLLPVIGLLLADYRRLAYTVVFPAVLLLTFANPLLSFPVATYVTSKDVYHRLFWLLPVGVGLGSGFALSGRLAQKIVARRNHHAWRHLPLAVVAAEIGLLAALPGVYVWGTGNSNGPYMVPRLTPSLGKVPPDLLAVLDRLTGDPDLERHPVLCGEEVASFLTPMTSRITYVTSREFYLPGKGLDPRFPEATEQFLLLQVAYAGPYAGDLRKLRYFVGQKPTIAPEMLESVRRVRLTQEQELPKISQVPELLRRYQAEYVITPPPLWLDGHAGEEHRRQIVAGRRRYLEQLGYHEIFAGRDYELWQRTHEASDLSGRGP